MPSHTGGRVAVTGNSKVFEDLHKAHRLDYTLDDVEWCELTKSFLFYGIEDEECSVPLVDFITAALFQNREAPLHDLIQKTASVDQEKLVCEAVTPMTGNNFLFVIGHKNEVRTITIRTKYATINVTLANLGFELEAGHIIQIGKQKYVTTDFVDWELVMLQLKDKVTTKLRRLTTEQVIHYLLEEGKIVALVDKTIHLTADKAAGTLRHR